MPLIFSTPTILDPRCLTLMGVNIKPNSSNPIGYFGTGLKYAIAVLVRENIPFHILSGQEKWTFELESQSIRGKDFNCISMQRKNLDSFDTTTLPLPFTTEFAKNWGLLQAYRELASNTLDEQGAIIVRPDSPAHHPSWTRIIIDSPTMEELHTTQHSKLFLQSSPLFESNQIQFHPGPGHAIYYRGIAVLSLSKPSAYTYNILHEITLTEDRTAASEYDLQYKLAKAVARLSDPAIIKSILLAPPTSYDSFLDFSYPGPTAETTAFHAVARQLMTTRPADMNRMALAYMTQLTAAEAPESIQLSLHERRQLTQALNLLKRFKLAPARKDLHFSSSLGESCLGAVRADTIYISRKAFEMGTSQLAATILEEHIHKSLGHADCSREMQNFLLDQVIHLMEQLQKKRN